MLIYHMIPCEKTSLTTKRKLNSLYLQLSALSVLHVQIRIFATLLDRTINVDGIAVHAWTLRVHIFTVTSRVYCYITGSIELEKKKTETIKEEQEATMNDLLDISNGGESRAIAEPEPEPEPEVEAEPEEE